MEERTTSHARMSVLTALVILTVAATTGASAATTYTILFGGSVGFAYSPNSLSVSVGDTIRWSGSFATHPLVSTTIPPDAAPWSNSSGTEFRYVVELPGTYNYKCDVHVGMVGSFTAAATGVQNDQNSGVPRSLQLLQNYPNPFNPSTTITYALPRDARVTLTLFNMVGQEVATLARGEQEAGYHEVRFDGGGLPSGVYVYKLQAGTQVQTRRLVLLR
jgi:plastocyanin